MRRLEGKVAIVTGAASGIGRATATKLAAEGGSVLVADINGSGAKRVADAIGETGAVAAACEVDVADEAAVVAMVAEACDRYGGLDVLHNNAAALGPDVLGQDTDVASMSVELWDRTLAVNLRGVMLGCKHAVPRMLERGGGSIVNTSSGSSYVGDLIQSAYGASKAGINALTLYVATQYGKRGVRCNAVAPGLTLTPALKAQVPRHEIDVYEANTLTPRVAEPEDIANAVAYLASDEAALITGQVLCVDGGMYVHMPTFAHAAG
jgi:NAD(P)-dependent dehydrogenase (short-subunit alcohol dehydrogenase family)